MPDKKTLKMAEFYKACNKKGYTDMKDETQALKAKVIAVDMGLKYKDIVKFYEEARRCTEVVAEEKKREKELLAEKKKAEENQRRRDDESQLIMTLSFNGGGKLEVYMRADKSRLIKTSLFIKGKKSPYCPDFKVVKSTATSLTYQPAKAVYTGATVGGVTTGGVHYTQEGYSVSQSRTGNADIKIATDFPGGNDFVLREIILSEFVYEKYKRDSDFKAFWGSEPQPKRCYRVDNLSGDYMKAAVATGDMTHMLNTVSLVSEREKLSYNECKKIVAEAEKILEFNFPPTDEEYYLRAVELSKVKTVASVKEAMSIFKKISDYKDSQNQYKKLSSEFGDIEQREKEEAVIAAEKRREQNKKKMILGGIIIAVAAAVIIALSVASANARKAALTESGLTYLEQGNYELAIDAFTQADDKENLNECYYRRALYYLEEGRFEAAAEAFAALGDYKDSRNMNQEIKYQEAYSLRYTDVAKSRELFTELGDYSDSQEQLSKFKKLNTAQETDTWDHVYEYEKGRLVFIKSQTYSDGYYYEYESEKEYNEDGLLIRTVRDGSMNTGYEHTVTEYDEHGYETKVTTSYPAKSSRHGTVKETVYKNTYYKNGNIKTIEKTESRWNEKTEVYSSEPKLVTTTSYTENGDEKIVKNHSDGTVFIERYDEYGNRVYTENQYSGRDPEITVYTNEYDENGLHIKQSTDDGAYCIFKYDEDGMFISAGGKNYTRVVNTYDWFYCE